MPINLARLGHNNLGTRSGSIGIDRDRSVHGSPQVKGRDTAPPPRIGGA
ncbi:MAG: hypothetical protein ACO4AJ_09865 [Prochlorothrix sp.]